VAHGPGAIVSDLRGIRHISSIMQPILDLPLSAHQLEQPLRGGHPGGQAREAIADLVPGATSGQLRPTFHLERLSHIGKGAVTSQQTCAGYLRHLFEKSAYCAQ
jgi:hypothetical protein